MHSRANGEQQGACSCERRWRRSKSGLQALTVLNARIMSTAKPSGCNPTQPGQPRRERSTCGTSSRETSSPIAAWACSLQREDHNTSRPAPPARRPRFQPTLRRGLRGPRSPRPSSLPLKPSESPRVANPRRDAPRSRQRSLPPLVPVATAPPPPSSRPPNSLAMAANPPLCADARYAWKWPLPYAGEIILLSRGGVEVKLEGAGLRTRSSRWSTRGTVFLT